MNDPQFFEIDGKRRFEVRRRIGAGGFGVVYEAYDLERDTTVALKVLHATDADALYLFKQEFRALADVTHLNVAVLYELFTTGPHWFFTMELVAGVNLLDHVWSPAPGAGRDPASTERRTERTSTLFGSRRSQRLADVAAAVLAEGGSAPAPATAPIERDEVFLLDEDRLRASLRQLADGIQAIHAARKLHRDIKPSNVLVTRDGRVVILDFGLAADLSRRGTEQEEYIVGTAAYMSPEQAAGEPLTEASDWYSVGAILYEALTGVLPFDGGVTEVMERKRVADPPPPLEVAPDAPADLCDLCRDLLARRPEHRPAGPEILRRLGPGPGVSLATGGEPALVAQALPTCAPPTSLVGRERHLDALADAYIRAERGTTVVAFVHGRSGMGKTALVRHFLDQVAYETEAVVLQGRCYERESVPFKALDSLVDDLGRYLMRIPGGECAALLPRDVPALARLFPVLTRVEAVAGAPRRGLDVPDAHELRRRASAALRDLLGRIAARRPLVLYIDDLQWGDLDSLEIIEDILCPPDPPPLLLLGSYRTEEAGSSPFLQALLATTGLPHGGTEEAGSRAGDERKTPAGPGSRARLTLGQRDRRGSETETGEGSKAGDLRIAEATEIVVGPLGPDEAGELAQALLRETGGPAVADGAEGVLAAMSDEIVRESRGNPFFVGELVRYVQEGSGLAAASAEITLERVLGTRFSRLPEGARRLLVVVAVAGRPIAEALALEAAELDRKDWNAVASLRAARLVQSRGARDDRLETYHDRVRETVVAGLDERTLRAQHRRLAHVLEASNEADPETLAVHFLGAGERARAADYATAAAHKASQALAFHRAARLYRLALEASPAGTTAERDLRTRLADALRDSGRGAEAGREYLLAAAGAQPAPALELRRRAAEQLLLAGRIDEGLGVMRGVLEAVGMALAPTRFRAILSLLLRSAYLRLRGIGFRERAESEVPAQDLVRIDTCWSAASALSHVDLMRAAELQKRHMLLALRAGEMPRIARALMLESGYSSLPGGRARGRAESLVRTTKALAERIGHRSAHGRASFVDGIASFFLGEWRRSHEQVLEAEERFAEGCTGVGFEVHTLKFYVLSTSFYLGRWDEIRRRLPAIVLDARERGDLYTETYVRCQSGAIPLLMADEPLAAARELKESAARWPVRDFFTHTWWNLWGEVHAAVYAGDPWRAASRMEESFAAIRGTLLLEVQYLRVETYRLRALATLAAAAMAGAVAGPAAKAREELIRCAERDAGRMERERMPWSDALARLLRSGIAATRGERPASLAHLAAAETGFEGASMALFAAVARRRRGALEGGARGEALVAGADGFMKAQGIASPARVTAMLAPGFT